MVLHLRLASTYGIMTTMTPPQKATQRGVHSINATTAEENIPASSTQQLHQQDNQWIEVVKELCGFADYFYQNKAKGLGTINIFLILYGAKLCLQRAPCE